MVGVDYGVEGIMGVIRLVTVMRGRCFGGEEEFVGFGWFGD